MPLTLKLLAGAAAVGLSFGAAAQPAPQGATQQQPMGESTAQQASQDSTETQPAALKSVSASDVKAGAAVNDAKGNPVGKVESVKGNSAVVSTGSARAQIPLSSLGRNDKGLVIAMTKSQFEAAAKAKSPK